MANNGKNAGAAGASDSESVLKNLYTSQMPRLIQVGVKWGLSLVPPGSNLDKILEAVEKNWDLFSSIALLIIMQFTKNKKEVDDALSELRAEITRSLEERYKNGKKTGEDKITKTTENETVLIIASTLTEAEFNKFLELVAGLSNEDQKTNFLNYLISLKTGKSVVSNWLKLGAPQFQLIVNALVPVPKPKAPRESSKFEREVKKGIDEFQEDAGLFLKKKGFLQRMSEEVDAKRINNRP